jgi:tripeptidyl-peptidase II
MRNHSMDASCQMCFHFVQLEVARSFRLTEFDKSVRLSPNGTFQCYFHVQDKRTLELCVACWWSSLSSIESDYDIEFHSVVVSPSTSIHLSSSQAYQRILLENRVRSTCEQITALPVVHWKSLVQTLRPNKDESRIQCLSRRDCFAQQRQIQQLVLVYHFTLVRRRSFDMSPSHSACLVFQLKPSEVHVKCPHLHELLYDNEYEAALWMCFDSNKQYLGAGDVVKDVRRAHDGRRRCR